MKHALGFLLLSILVTACSQTTSNEAPPPPVGHANVAIKQNGAVTFVTRFDNQSKWDYFECHKASSQYSIKARRYVRVPGKAQEERTFEFFFPDTNENWSGSAVMVTGGVGGKRLGGSPGACTSTLHFAGNVMTGEISCENFVATDDLGIGAFNFEISDLLCTLT